MKQIQAIIRNEKLNDVKNALDLIQCPGMMVWEIVGHGKQKGISESFRGQAFKVDFLPKTKIEIVVPEAQVKAIVDAIIKAAATGQVGDGKIFVTNVEQAVRIRTGESGDVAVN